MSAKDAFIFKVFST